MTQIPASWHEAEDFCSQIPTTYSSQKRTAPQPPTQWSEQEPDPSSIYNIEDLRSHSRSLLSEHRRSGKRSPRGPDRTFSLLFLFHSPVPVSPFSIFSFINISVLFQKHAVKTFFRYFFKDSPTVFDSLFHFSIPTQKSKGLTAGNSAVSPSFLRSFQFLFLRQPVCRFSRLIQQGACRYLQVLRIRRKSQPQALNLPVSGRTEQYGYWSHADPCRMGRLHLRLS